LASPLATAKVLEAGSFQGDGWASCATLLHFLATRGPAPRDASVPAQEYWVVRTTTRQFEMGSLLGGYVISPLFDDRCSTLLGPKTVSPSVSCSDASIVGPPWRYTVAAPPKLARRSTTRTRFPLLANAAAAEIRDRRGAGVRLRTAKSFLDGVSQACWHEPAGLARGAPLVGADARSSWREAQSERESRSRFSKAPPA